MFRTRAAISSLLLCTLGAASAEAQVLAHTGARYGVSSAYCLTTSPDESRIYVGDGASISILDASGVPSAPPTVRLPPPIAQVSLDASVVGLLHDQAPNPVLYVAGGSVGLLKMDTTESSPCSNCLLGQPGGCHTVTSLDDDDPASPALADNDKWCFDLDFLGEDYLVAVFAALGQTELRVYGLAQLRSATGPVAPVQVVSIPASSAPAAVGTGWAVSVRGPMAYLAMGEQGIVRVDFTNFAQPLVQQGPVFASTNNPYQGQPGDVRDVLVTQRWLYAAVDGLGVAQVDLNSGWSACLQPGGCTNVTLFPLSVAGSNPAIPRYAYRLSAQPNGPGKILLGVATHGSPARAEESNLLTPWSTMSFDVQSGVLPAGYVDGDAPQLLLFDATTALGLQPATQQVVSDGVHSTWRTLLLGKASGKIRSYELHWSEVHVRNLSTQGGMSIGILASRMQDSMFGSCPPRIGYSRLDPTVLLTTRDFTPAPIGYLIECASGCIEVATKNDLSFGQITNFESPWIESLSSPLQTREWIIGGSQAEWKVTRLNPRSWCGTGQMPLYQRFGLAPPPDNYGGVGRLAFMSHRDDAWDPDLLLMTRAGSRYGLLAFSRSEIEARGIAYGAAGLGGKELTDGTLCPTCPPVPTARFQLDTHPEFDGWSPPSGFDPVGLFSGTAFTLDCDTIQLQDAGASKWVTVAAAGYHMRDPADPNLNLPAVVDAQHFHEAELVLYDLSTQPPTLRAKLYGNAGPGNATDVKTRTLNGRTYAFATDYGGRFLVFDITDVFALPAPAVLTPVYTWTAPAGLLDGAYENATEVEIDSFQVGTQTHTVAYTGFYRLGVVVFDLTQAPSFSVDRILDTPGLAEGVRLRDVGGSKSLLVADRMGGVRILVP